MSVPSDTPTLIVAPNVGRTELFITNNDPTITVYIGPVPYIDTTNAWPLYAHDTVKRHRGFQIWLGPVYALAESGTVDMRMWETYDTAQNMYDRLGNGVDTNNIYVTDDQGIIITDDEGRPIVG